MIAWGDKQQNLLIAFTSSQRERERERGHRQEVAEVAYLLKGLLPSFLPSFFLRPKIGIQYEWLSKEKSPGSVL